MVFAKVVLNLRKIFLNLRKMFLNLRKIFLKNKKKYWRHVAPHFVPSVTNASVGAKCHTRADFGHVRPLPKILEVPQVFLCLVDVGIGFFILRCNGMDSRSTNTI